MNRKENSFIIIIMTENTLNINIRLLDDFENLVNNNKIEEINKKIEDYNHRMNCYSKLNLEYVTIIDGNQKLERQRLTESAIKYGIDFNHMAEPQMAYLKPSFDHRLNTLAFTDPRIIMATLDAAKSFGMVYYKDVIDHLKISKKKLATLSEDDLSSDMTMLKKLKKKQIYLKQESEDEIKIGENLYNATDNPYRLKTQMVSKNGYKLMNLISTGALNKMATEELERMKIRELLPKDSVSLCALIYHNRYSLNSEKTPVCNSFLKSMFLFDNKDSGVINTSDAYKGILSFYKAYKLCTMQTIVTDLSNKVLNKDGIEEAIERSNEKLVKIREMQDILYSKEMKNMDINTAKGLLAYSYFTNLVRKDYELATEKLVNLGKENKEIVQNKIGGEIPMIYKIEDTWENVEMKINKLSAELVEKDIEDFFKTEPNGSEIQNEIKTLKLFDKYKETAKDLGKTIDEVAFNTDTLIKKLLSNSEGNWCGKNNEFNKRFVAADTELSEFVKGIIEEVNKTYDPNAVSSMANKTLSQLVKINQAMEKNIAIKNEKSNNAYALLCFIYTADKQKFKEIVDNLAPPEALEKLSKVDINKKIDLLSTVLNSEKLATKIKEYIKTLKDDGFCKKILTKVSRINRKICKDALDLHPKKKEIENTGRL